MDGKALPGIKSQKFTSLSRISWTSIDKSPLVVGEGGGGRLRKHARYYWLSLPESHLTQRDFGAM